MKTLIAIAAGLIASAALVLAWLNFSSARAARVALADIAAEQAKLKDEVERAQQRAAAAKHDEAELQAVLTELRNHAAPSAPPAKKPAPPVPPPSAADILKLMDANPELRSLFQESTRAGISSRFRLLYAAANLTPEQIRKFEDVMLEDAEEKMDLTALIQKQGVAPNDPDVQKMRQESEARLKAGQKAALGEDGYRELQEFARTQPALGFIAEVSTLVSDRSTPLNESQASRLRAIMADASPAYRAGGRVDPAAVEWDRVLTDAQPFLSPAQLKALRAQSQMGPVFGLIKQFYERQNAAAGK